MIHEDPRLQLFHAACIEFGWMIALCNTWDKREWSTVELKELMEDESNVVKRLWACASGETPWPYTMKGMSPIYKPTNGTLCLAGFVPIGHNLSGVQWNMYSLTSKEGSMTKEARQASRSTDVD